MASSKLMQTKDGKPFYKLHCRPIRGKDFYKRWYVPEGWSEKAIQRELAKQEAEFERQCKNGEILTRQDQEKLKNQREAEEAKILTLEQFCEQVFMHIKSATMSKNSIYNFNGILKNHIYPSLGHLKIPEITTVQITASLTKRIRSGASHATVIKHYELLNLIFKMAYMQDLVNRNPMDKVERPKPRKDEGKHTDPEAYTASELKHIMDCLENEPLKWQCYVRILIDTGIRRGECCGLQWSDFDFAKQTVTIQRNLGYTSTDGIFIDTTKNGRTRTIDLDSEIFAMLRKLRMEQAQSALSRFVFTQDGTPDPMHPTSPTHYFKVFSKRYGITDFHPHKLRHSFASVAITSGADVASVSEKLGHSDKSVTLRMYTHADEESIRRTSETFREALRNA